MFVECRGTYAWSSKVCLIFLQVFALTISMEESVALASDGVFGDSESVINRKPARRKLDDIAGSINIDCGLPEDCKYIDAETGLQYTSDASFIRSGINKNISSKFSSTTLHKSLTNVRSFPQGKRNCYTLRPPEGHGTMYLIRASFMYGNYDELNQVPQFDLYIGVNMWDSVKLDNASHLVMKEILHAPSDDDIYVCLVNIGYGEPFISSLEVRHFHDSSYKTESGSLALYRRLDAGSTTNEIVRFKDDAYDRIWFPYNLPDCESLNTTVPIDSHAETEYKLPSKVMTTAIRPMNSSASLDFDFDIGDSTLEFYVYMHFAELEGLQENQTRNFSITLNVRGSKLKFSIYKTLNSSLPPILNAMEIYMVKDLLQAPTCQEDVNGISRIKSFYLVEKNWQGDPCAPVQPWDGLTCSNNGYESPRIISLNLSSSGLRGTISPSLLNLTALQFLDLSNNSLTGELPEFLSRLSFLTALNVTGNKLSGSVPPDLIARSEKGSLSLSVANNPDLCPSAQCKENKNSVGPIVAAVVSSLVIIFLALVIIWSLKRRKKATKSLVRSPEETWSLKMENQRFRYSEIARLLMRVHHRNVASLVGYCHEGTNMGLIYEYMAGGNLQNYLSGADISTSPLSWIERLQIAVDAAQGLEYMHCGCKPPIIHRDVKTANILLSEKLQAKIADFGFSRFFSIESETHATTAVVGTIGYIDPELTEKSDVYSFGIVLLELITGKPAIIKDEDNIHIVQWVRSFVERGNIGSIVDPRLQGNLNTNSVWRVLETAMACLPPIAIQRVTMSHVVMQLKECLEEEKAHDQTRRMEEQATESSNSIDLYSLDLELEMGPEAR
ncbi:putative leucine-rich repeat receptor-like protein kinase [Vitis vinifera]|uniref:Putative leucine-rich repeat receptor-like protein kinase n=1 Tax=Vitis vinifera TaxID=29760 RepID=A0A438EW17_VITVI|nr:putative leucine-rich repeat receptor-like protein kinase [Vitis vinifera]